MIVDLVPMERHTAHIYQVSPLQHRTLQFVLATASVLLSRCGIRSMTDFSQHACPRVQEREKSKSNPFYFFLCYHHSFIHSFFLLSSFILLPLILSSFFFLHSLFFFFFFLSSLLSSSFPPWSLPFPSFPSSHIPDPLHLAHLPPLSPPPPLFNQTR